MDIAEPAGSGIGHWLRGVFPVKRNELLTVALLALNVFILLNSYYILKVVREPLILLGGGANWKAYASAFQALLLLGVVPAFSYLSARVSRIRLLTIMQVIFIGCLIVFYLLAQAKAPIGLAFYVWLGIFNALVVSNFWSFANDLYTEEQGKRVFGLIGVGASIGAIAGAFLPRVLEPILQIHGLMALAVACLGVSIALYRIVDARESERAKREVASAKSDESHDKSGGFGMVMKNRYLRLIAFMLLVATTVNSTGEFIVGEMAETHAKAHVQEVFATDPPPADKTAREKKEKEIAGTYLSNFYSEYYTLVNLVGALLQAFVVARLLTWLGIRKALFIMPVIVFGGWIACVFFLNTMMVRVEKTTENSLDYSLHNTLRQALFLPTSHDAKFKAKAAIDTFFFRMGDVVSAFVLVLIFSDLLGMGLRVFAGINIALCCLWLFLVWRTGKAHDELVAQQHSDEHQAA
ncbi:MAG: Npt1/Npt2 family nucleotide transporter [Kofleriaceae bacterium]